MVPYSYKLVYHRYHPHQTRDFPLHSPSTSHQFPPMSTLSDKARQHVRWRLSPGSSQKDGIGCTFSHLTCKWAGNTTWSIPTMGPSFSSPPSPPPKKWFGASVQCETGAKDGQGMKAMNQANWETSWNFLHMSTSLEGTPQVLGFLLGLLGEQSHILTLWRFSSHPRPTAHFGMGVSKNGRTCCIHKWHSSSLVAETGGNFSCS